MKNLNQYHFFGAAFAGLLLIILAMMLFGCTKEEPEPTRSGYDFFAVVKYPDKICLTCETSFVVLAADTFDEHGELIRPQFVCSLIEIGEIKSGLRYVDTDYLSLKGKYIQLRTYQMGTPHYFVQCEIFVNHNGINIYHTCSGGYSKPLLIN